MKTIYYLLFSFIATESIAQISADSSIHPLNQVSGQLNSQQSCQGVFLKISDGLQANLSTANDTLYLPASGNLILEANFDFNCPSQIQNLVVEWYLNGVLIFSGSPYNLLPLPDYYYQSFITITQTGNYQVAFEGFGIYSNNITVLDSMITEISELNNSNIKTYPIPCQNTLNIEIHESIEMISIQIINSIGDYISIPFTELNNHFIFDMGNQSRGLYFIQVITSHGKLIRKIIKN